MKGEYGLCGIINLIKGKYDQLRVHETKEC